MKFLLDTHALIWFVEGNKQFSDKAKATIEAEDAEVFVSVASVWEIAIKASLGKLRLRLSIGEELRDFLSENGFQILDIEYAHAAQVAALPFNHKDPFDRLLVAQALNERITVLSQDAAFDSYNIVRIW